MSIDDLKAERSYLRGKITACDTKIRELEKTIKREKKDLEDLKYDKRCTDKILNKLSGIPGLLGKSDTNINGARDTVASYYNGYDTDGWKQNLKKISNLAGSIKGSISSVAETGSTVQKDLEVAIGKKEIDIANNEASLKTAREDVERYESDLEDVQWEIDNYDYDDD